MSTTIPARYVGQILEGIRKLSPYIDDFGGHTGVKRISLGDDVDVVLDANFTSRRVQLKEPIRDAHYQLDPYATIIWLGEKNVAWLTAERGESSFSLEETTRLFDAISEYIHLDVKFHEKEKRG